VHPSTVSLIYSRAAPSSSMRVVPPSCIVNCSRKTMTIPLCHPFTLLWVIPRHETQSRLLQLGFSRKLLRQLVLFLPLSLLLGLAWIHLMMASCLSTQCSHLHAPSGLPSPVDTLRCHLCPLRPGFSWSLRLCYTTTKHSILEEESTTYTTSRGSATGIEESCHRSWGV
jgi:hypothetical protein